jgi:SAM-dependent methyltransferase
MVVITVIRMGMGGLWMGMVGSYFSDHQWPGERRRLTLLEERYDPGTIRRLVEIGVGRVWSCLEVGAGAGSIARWLAHRVGPTGRVVATDLDIRFFDATEANLKVWRHDISCDPLPTAEFDLVHVRWLLDLLPDREASVEKLIAALRPGGWLLVEEPDMFPTAAESSEEYRQLMEATAALLQSVGANHQWARTLPTMLTAAGLIGVGAEADVDIFQGGSPMAEFRQLGLAQLREALLQTGVITEVELSNGAAYLSDSSHWLMGLASVAAWGQKPSKLTPRTQ